jgi:signal transduction histidine kinase
MDKKICIGINDLIIICAAIASVFFICCFLLHRSYKIRLLNVKGDLQLIHQRELYEETLRAQEEERSRIGQNLHDDVGSALASLKFTIETAVFDFFDQTSFNHFIFHCRTLIDRATSSVRGIAHNLSPVVFELFGLVAAIEELGNAFNNIGTLEINVESEAEEVLQSLDQSVALSLFRIFEELITNTIKHAEAKRVTISISSGEGFLSIIYSDDGKGVENQTSNGMGLKNIKKRLHILNAAYDINTSAGNGFSIEMIISTL